MRRMTWGLALVVLLIGPAEARAGEPPLGVARGQSAAQVAGAAVAEPLAESSADGGAQAAEAAYPAAGGDVVEAGAVAAPTLSGPGRVTGRIHAAAAAVPLLRSVPERVVLLMCAVLPLLAVVFGVMLRRRSMKAKRHADVNAGADARRMRIRFAQGLLANGAAPAEVARRTRIARDALVTLARVAPRGMAAPVPAYAGARRRATVRGGKS